jgi:hypothetical protein
MMNGKLFRGWRSWLVAAGRLLPLLALAATTRAGAAPPAPYAQKPEWWDGTRFFVAAGATLEEVLKDSLAHSGNQPQLSELSGWYVLGPLDSRQGNALEETLPGEAELNIAQTVAGKDGRRVAWRRQADPAQPALDPKLEQFAALFYLPDLTARPGRRFLKIEHDDGALVRVNHRVAYTAAGRSAAVVPIVLGNHNRLLVKLVQVGGAWGVRAWLLEEHPLWKPIRVRTDALRRFAEREPAAAVPAAQALADAYEQLDDLPNALHWHLFVLRNTADATQAGQLLDRIRNRCHAQGAEGLFAHFCQQLVRSPELPPELRQKAAGHCLEAMGNGFQFTEALAFLEAEQATLRPLLGLDWDLWVARMLISRGETERARELLRALPQDQLSPSGKQTFDRCWRFVLSLQRSLTQVPRDLDFELALNEVALQARQNDRIRLAERIRACLQEKAALVVEGAEPGLYTGAVVRYREAFQPYAEMYEPAVRQYVQVLIRRFGYDAAQAHEILARLSLKPPPARPAPRPAAAAGPAVAALAAPVSGLLPLGFAPAVALPPGEVDAHLARTGVEGAPGQPVPGWPSANFSGTLLFQNSRLIARASQGRQLWRTGFDNSRPLGNPGQRILGDRFSPKEDGRRAYARLLRNGRFVLAALDLATGAPVWTWDDPGHQLCTDPVPWGESVLAVVMKPDVMPSFYLASWNAATGESEFELLLFSANPESDLGGGSRGTRLEWFMPEPAVADGMAYLNTNLGVIAAVNLPGRHLQWLRTYNRLPFLISGDIAALPVQRRGCPPVVGGSNLLCATRDGASLLLLDRATGRLVAESSRRQWLDCRPAGANTAFLTLADGGAAALSLRDLRESFTLAGGRTEILASCADGILLNRENRLELWSETGRLAGASGRFPAELALAGFDGSRCWGWRRGSPEPWLGVLSEPAGASPPLPVEPGFPANLADAAVLDAGAGEPVLHAATAVVGLTADLHGKWSWPLLEAGAGVEVVSATVYIVQNGTVTALDRASSRPVGQFPATGPGSGSILAPIRIDDGLLFGFRPPGTHEVSVYALARGTVRTVATLKERGGQPLGLFRNGNLLLDRDRKLRLCRPAGGVYKQFAEAPYPAGGQGRGWTASRHLARLEPDAWLAYHPKGSLLITADKFAPFATADWGEAGGGDFGEFPWQSWHRQLAPDLLAVRLHRNGWSLVDGRHKVDLSAKARFAVPPSLLSDDLAAGLLLPEKAEKGKLVVGVLDRKAGRLLYRKPLDLGSFIDARFAPAHDFSLLWKGKAWHFFGVSQMGAGQPPRVVAVADDLKPGTPLVPFLFPPFRVRGGAGLARQEALLLLVENRAVRLTDTAFAALLPPAADASPPPVPASAPAVKPAPAAGLQVDGYLDDWDSAAFRPLRPGVATAARWGKDDQLYLAFKFTEPAVLRLLAQRGFGGFAQFVALPAGSAGFAPEDAARDGVEILLGPAAEGFAWSEAFTPDGSLATVELRLPLARVAPGFGRAAAGRPPRAVAVAFDLQLRGLGLAPVSLLTVPQTWPCQWPRLRLEAE